MERNSTFCKGELCITTPVELHTFRHKPAKNMTERYTEMNKIFKGDLGCTI